MIFQCILFHDWSVWTDKGVFKLFRSFYDDPGANTSFIQQERRCSRCGKVQIRKEKF